MQRPCREREPERVRRARARERARRLGAAGSVRRARIGIPESKDSAESAESGTYARAILTGSTLRPEFARILL